MPFSETAKNTMLDSLTANRVNIHNGDPGVDGTSNAIGTLTAAVFDAAASGARALNADVSFTGLGSHAAVTWFSVWKAAGSVFLGSGQINIGDDEADVDGKFNLKAGSTTLTLSDS